MSKLIKPVAYDALLDMKQTEQGIKLIKEFFQQNLSTELRLRRVTAPLFVLQGLGINDDLNGVERAVTFPIKVRTRIITSCTTIPTTSTSTRTTSMTTTTTESLSFGICSVLLQLFVYLQFLHNHNNLVHQMFRHLFLQPICFHHHRPPPATIMREYK